MGFWVFLQYCSAVMLFTLLSKAPDKGLLIKSILHDTISRRQKLKSDWITAYSRPCVMHGWTFSLISYNIWIKELNSVWFWWSFACRHLISNAFVLFIYFKIEQWYLNVFLPFICKFLISHFFLLFPLVSPPLCYCSFIHNQYCKCSRLFHRVQ